MNTLLESVKNPITYTAHKWSGEKMIIIPSLINDELTRDTVIEYFASKKSDSFGIVAITPSFEKAKEYGGYGATVADNKTVLIHPIISDL